MNTGSSGRQSLVPFRLKDLWMVMAAEQVREFQGEIRWVVIPGAPAVFPGVMAWRGQALAVLDLGAATGAVDPLRPGQLRKRTLVATAANATLAVPVDAVREVVHVEATRVVSSHASQVRFCAKEVDLDGTVMPLLDLPFLLETHTGTQTREGP